MILPLEIRRQQFNLSVRGYKPLEVDEFLQQLADDYDRLFDENDELRRTVALARKRLEACQTMEHNLEKAWMVTAQRGEEIKEKALQEADQVVSAARLRVDEIRREYRDISTRIYLYQSWMKEFMAEHYHLITDPGPDLGSEEQYRLGWFELQKILVGIDAAIVDLVKAAAAVEFLESSTSGTSTLVAETYQAPEPERSSPGPALITGKTGPGLSKTGKLDTFPIITRPALPREQFPAYRSRMRRIRAGRLRRIAAVTFFVVGMILALLAGWAFQSSRNPTDDARVPNKVQNGSGVGVEGLTYREQMKQVLIAGSLEDLNKLLRRNISPDIALSNGETPLMISAYQGNTEMMEALLEAGADPDIKNKRHGLTALMYASYRGNMEAVRLLLDHNTSVNLRSREGWSALMAAAYDGHPATVKLLLQRGADPDFKTDEGWTAYDLAVLNQHPVTAKALGGDGSEPQGPELTSERRQIINAMFQPETLSRETP